MKLRIANASGRPTLSITLLLASLSMVSPLSIDTFFPSLPTIAADFGLTDWQVQQLVTAYMLPFAVFVLAHGPISDALGRRRVVIAGLVLYTLGSIGCLVAPGFGMLLACRVLQGLAAGVGPTVARAMIRDLFDGPNAQRLMTSMMLVFSLAPAVAPVLGGWVHVALGWRSVFGMLAVLGAALVLICALMLPETHPPSRRTAFHPVTLIRSCWRVASGAAFFLLAVSSALAFACLFMYIGAAPAIILESWHLSETQFHYLFIPVVGGFMTASFVGGRMAGYVSRPRQLALGFSVLCGASAVDALAHLLAGTLPVPVMQVLLFCKAMGAQFIVPVLTLDLVDMHPEARGAASSVQSFIMLVIATLVMGTFAPLLHGDLALMSYLSIASVAAAWLTWRAATELRRRG